tara:strand:- start:2046 stop:2240 length:195 start_codon:yes stop_codon:yes gene_type:complete
MSDATHGGKGDRQRKVNKQQYDSNFDRIFKQEKTNEQSYDKGKPLQRDAESSNVGGEGTGRVEK